MNSVRDETARIEDFIAEHRQYVETPKPTSATLARVYEAGTALQEESTQRYRDFVTVAVEIAERLQRDALDKTVPIRDLQKLEIAWENAQEEAAAHEEALDSLAQFCEHVLSLHQGVTWGKHTEEEEQQASEKPWWKRMFSGAD